MLLEQVTIQNKIQQLLNKGLNNDVIDKLLQCDPTNKDKNDSDKVGSYTDWIVSRYLKDRQFNDFNKLHQQLEQYNKSKHKIPDPKLRNINQFETLDDLIIYINNNQDKLVIKSDKFVIEERNDYDMFYSKNYIIHVPHTKEQSKILGSGTKWCTSQEKNNYFQMYYNEGYLFYITDKTTRQKKYNLYLQNQGAKIEFADDKNKHLTYKFFDIVKEDNTLIPQIKYYYEYKNIEPTYKLQLFLNCKTVSDVVKFWKDNINKFADIYFEKDENKLLNSIKIADYNIKFIPNPSPKIQLQQLTKNMNNINFIESPDNIVLKTLVVRHSKQIQDIINAGIRPEHDIQLQQVSQDGRQIQDIINAGIRPEHDIQLQQVSQDGRQIQDIINAGIRPEYDIQLQQVSQDGLQIKHIIDAGVQPEDENEWHNIQLQQVTRYGNQIKYIINAGVQPEHDVQLQQVSQNGDQIYYIIKAGIKPEHDIQLQQVSQYGNQIQYIINAGVQPEHDVQLQQVSQNGDQIYYIIKAGVQPEDDNKWHDIQLQQVKQLGYQIKYIPDPPEEVQLQQINKDWFQIEYITNPTESAQLQQVTQNGRQIRHISNPSEKIQVQQINHHTNQYYYIENPTPQQTQLFKKLKGIKESTGYISKLLDVN